MKDRKDADDQAGIVYKLDCRECDNCYVRETGRLLKERKEEHKKDIQKRNPLSNVYHHVRDTGHAFNFEDVKIVGKEQEKFKRKYLESVHTAMNAKSINRSHELNQMYQPLLRRAE